MRILDYGLKDKTLGVFGGVFDPPHHGHLFLAETLKDYLDEIVFVPCGNPPHKRTPKASKQERLRMTQLAVNDRFRISDIELKDPDLSYTIDTVVIMQNVVKCKVHPKYKAIRRPQCDCLDCWKMFCNALEEKFKTTNNAMLKCSCYSTSFCSEGNYYLVRNDCPVHKGTLQQ